MITIGNFSFIPRNGSRNSIKQETNIIWLTILVEHSVSCVENKLGGKVMYINIKIFIPVVQMRDNSGLD